MSQDEATALRDRKVIRDTESTRRRERATAVAGAVASGMTANEATNHVTTAMITLGIIIILTRGWLVKFRDWVREKTTSVPQIEDIDNPTDAVRDFLETHPNYNPDTREGR